MTMRHVSLILQAHHSKSDDNLINRIIALCSSFLLKDISHHCTKHILENMLTSYIRAHVTYNIDRFVRFFRRYSGYSHKYLPNDADWEFIASAKDSTIPGLNDYINLEVWLTTDIVSRNSASCHTPNDTLINPANPSFCGTLFPYFPRGGPLPQQELGRVSSMWGGMDAGDAMVYPAQSIDGLVHLAGGPELKEALREALDNSIEVTDTTTTTMKASGGKRMPVGRCAVTRTMGRLASCSYKHVIHTATPLACEWDKETELLPSHLVSCYLNSILHFLSTPSMQCAAIPLIGSGTAGFTQELSARCLKEALSQVAGRVRDDRLKLTVVGGSTSEVQCASSDSRVGKKILRIAVQTRSACTTVERVFIPNNL